MIIFDESIGLDEVSCFRPVVLHPSVIAFTIHNLTPPLHLPSKDTGALVAHPNLLAPLEAKLLAGGAGVARKLNDEESVPTSLL